MSLLRAPKKPTPTRYAAKRLPPVEGAPELPKAPGLGIDLTTDLPQPMDLGVERRAPDTYPRTGDMLQPAALQALVQALRGQQPRAL